ncbi:MAG: linear amide C-N hydrolase, partial [Clostridium sp.]
MCTNITLRGNKAIVTARTDEFAIMMPELEIMSFPRMMNFSTLSNGSGFKWENKYGYIGITTGKLFGEKNVLDGINEKGLAVQALYFPGYAGYEKIEDLSNAVSNLSICSYILGKFETVEEVKKAISNMNIVGEEVNGAIPPFHYQVNDS